MISAAESPLVLGLNRGYRSDWLYIKQGSIGYRWINPKSPRPPDKTWVDGSDDVWHFYPLDAFVKTDHDFVGFGHAHQTSTRGESERWWVNFLFVLLVPAVIGGRLAFGPASAAPLPILIPSASARGGDITTPSAPILSYESGPRLRLPHSIGIRIFSASTATFFIGLVIYFFHRSTQTLGGVFDWIFGINLSGGGAIFFFLLAIGRIKRRV